MLITVRIMPNTPKETFTDWYTKSDTITYYHVLAA